MSSSQPAAFTASQRDRHGYTGWSRQTGAKGEHRNICRQSIHGVQSPDHITLPSSVRSAPSLLQFRRDLKTALHVSVVIVLFTIVSSCVTIRCPVTDLFVKCHLKLHIDTDTDITLHSGFASTPFAASTETSGVQDCVSGTPVDYVDSTDVPMCRHATRLRARSSSSPLIFLQNTRCSTHTYHTLGDRSFAVAGPRVWNSLPATIRQITTSYGQFRQHLKTHLFRA